MKARIAAAAALAGVTLAGALAAPASATGGSTDQRYCNSSASQNGTRIDVVDKDGYYQTLGQGQCLSVYRPSGVSLSGVYSFRVGYNLGPYQGCQNLPNGYKKFTAAAYPNTIYFKLFLSSCNV